MSQGIGLASALRPPDSRAWKRRRFGTWMICDTSSGAHPPSPGFGGAGGVTLLRAVRFGGAGAPYPRTRFEIR